MKKKLTTTSLAWGNLKKRKKQYITLLVGIILAMVFSSGTLFFISCLFSSQNELWRVRYGNANYIAFELTEDNFAKLDAQSNLADYGLAHVLGYGYTEEQEKGSVIAWLDDYAKELYAPVLLDGKYPESVGEIAAEQDALLCMGLADKQIGDTVSLHLQVQDGPDHRLTDAVEKTYTLVGILGDKRKYINNLDPEKDGYVPAIFTCAGAQTEIGGKEALSAYLAVRKGAAEHLDLSYMNFTSVDQNRFGDAFTSLLEKSVFSAVMSGVLMLASGLGIVNAFNSNLSERKKQIGLLRAVGATRRQIIGIYGRESFILSLISAPLSLLISYFGVKLITGFMDDFVFLPSWRVLLGSLAASLVFVLLASLIPLFAASRISPMQAIRNTELSRKMRRMKIRSKKLFKVPKLLAKRNLKFYRLRMALTSLILAVAVFISSYAFTYLLSASYTVMFDDYHIGLGADQSFEPYCNTIRTIGYTENDKQTLLDDPLVASVNGKVAINAVITADHYTDYMRLLNYNLSYSLFDDDFVQNITAETYGELDAHEAAAWTDFKEKLNLTNAAAVSVAAQDEPVVAGLAESVVEGRIDLDKLNSGEEVVLIAPKELWAGLHFLDVGAGYYLQVYPQKITIDGEELTWTETATLDMHVGDALNLTVVNIDDADENGFITENYTRRDKTVRIGAICYTADYTFWPDGGSQCGVITTMDGLRKLTDTYKYKFLNVTMAGEVTAEIDADMMRLIDRITSGVPSDVQSAYQLAQEERQSRRQMMIAISAIVILMLSVAGSMINNALTARIREGKREIGTLRAVGASASDLVRSYVIELLHMLGIGSTVGFAGFFALWFGKARVRDALALADTAGRTAPVRRLRVQPLAADTEADEVQYCGEY